MTPFWQNSRSIRLATALYLYILILWSVYTYKGRFGEFSLFYSARTTCTGCDIFLSCQATRAKDFMPDMSNKKRNYRKTGQDNDNVANVRRSEATSIVFSRLSFAGEGDLNLGNSTKVGQIHVRGLGAAESINYLSNFRSLNVDEQVTAQGWAN